MLTTVTPKKKIPQGVPLEELLDQSVKDPFEGGSNLRFGPDRTNNRFDPITNYSLLLTFPTWESTDDTYYYNLLKNKGPVKRKVTFGQTITTPPSNLLSEKQPRYQTRYQTRSNNSPEESSDDDDDNDNDNDNNLPPNHQPNQPPPSPPPPLNQNMNDGNRGGNNPPDGGQNNIMAQALTTLA